MDTHRLFKPILTPLLSRIDLSSIRNILVAFLMLGLSSCVGPPDGPPQEKAAYFCEAAREALAFGDDERCFSIYRKAIEAHPESFEGHLGIARMQIRRRKFFDATNSLHQAKMAAGNRGRFWELLGEAYGESRAFDDAIAAYARAHVMNPKSTTPLIRQGSLYLSMAMDSLAQVSFEQAATIDPEDGRIHAGLGRVHIRNGNPHSAAVYLELALEQTPTDPDLVCDYSNLLLQDKREVDAIRLLENVIESNPYHARIRYILSRCYAAVNRKLEAVRQTKAFERLRRTHQQIQSLENAVAEQPTADNYSALSHLYSRTGRDSLARASHRRATTLDPLVTAPQESYGFGSF